MQSLLFLCHRLPWPPDKGDKIRSYHLLRRLAGHYRVYLGTFVDDPEDWCHVPAVRALCAEACVRPLPPWRSRMRALGALVRAEALTPGCYRDRVMQRWIENLVAARRVDLALCYSSGVAPLVMRYAGLPRVMDFVDADSDKWRQYAGARRWPARMIYRREARFLAGHERMVAARFDASLFVSSAEAAFFRRRVPAAAGKVQGIPNGVDSDYWDPALDHPCPYAPGEKVVVFTGAMDYRANIDAVRWFADTVWPRVAARREGARFYIVGARPSREVRMLAARAGIHVTGRVDDVRPYLGHAHAVVAPLRIARGIQNKVLEALAMERVVVATPQAWEGIGGLEDGKGCVSSSPGVMADELVRWLGTGRPVRVPAARAMVLARFDWERNLDLYESVLRRAGMHGRDMPVEAAALGVCP